MVAPSFVSFRWPCEVKCFCVGLVYICTGSLTDAQTVSESLVQVTVVAGPPVEVEVRVNYICCTADVIHHHSEEWHCLYN